MASVTHVALIACGSFNPITNMHLRMFEIARDYLQRTGGYKVVGGIISPVNDDYGKKELISSKHRCAMIQLALRSSDWIRLDAWESDKESWTETVRVLRHHRSEIESVLNAKNTPSNKKRKTNDNRNIDNDNQNWRNTWDLSQPIQLKLLCGADLLESFSKPGLWKSDDMAEIVGSFGLICITREGANPLRFIYESDILSRYQNNIHIVTEWLHNEISATKIRRAIRREESIKYIVQDAVIEYIKTHDLYKSQEKNMMTCTPNIMNLLADVIPCGDKALSSCTWM